VVTGQDATVLIQEAMPLCATLGVRAEKYTAEEVVLALDWAPTLCTTGGILHGGVIMAVADSAGAACAFLNLPKDASGTATIESKTQLPGRGADRRRDRDRDSTPCGRRDDRGRDLGPRQLGEARGQGHADADGAAAERLIRANRPPLLGGELAFF
jgi:hypothetical protein